MVCIGINFIYTYSLSLSEPHAFEPRIRKIGGSDLTPPVLLIYLYKLVGCYWNNSLYSEFESLLLTPQQA
jgi:hypothetical protein